MAENHPPTPKQAPEAKTSETEGSPAAGARRLLPSFALTGLLVLATFYTLYVARLFLLPFVLALLLSLLLSPLVRALRHLRIPEGVGAAVVVLLLVAVATLGYLLINPAAEWLDRAPSSLKQIEAKLSALKKPVDKVREATQEMEKMARMPDKGPPAGAVQIEGESFAGALFGRLWTLVASLVVMFVLLYFLLASGDLFLRKLIRVLATLEDKKRAVEIARHLQADISVYLLTITIINLGLGVAVGSAMYLLGMPNPLLWGAIATILNYIPYLGAMVGIAVVAVVAALSFDTPGEILLPPLAYLLLTASEGYFLTPMVVGRRLTLNPVVVLLGLLFWGWLWGLIGAVLAVPMLVSFKILCDHIPPLSPWGEFLAK